MKNILVPLDFTSVGANALKFACKAFGESQITILYVKFSKVNTEDPLIYEQSLLSDDYWKEALKKYLCKELGLDRFPENIKLKISSGATVAGIISHCESSHYDGIVMGTRDKYNYFDKWFGTTTFGVIKKAKIPVYLIPKYATYSGYKRVMIASDDHLNNAIVLDKITSWNKEHLAFIKFLHIQDSKKDKFHQQKQLLITELFEKNNPEFAFEIEVIRDKDISHSLLASAYNMKADLLMVVPENQNYLQTILFKSISRELILKSDIPLLFFNSNL